MEGRFRFRTRQLRIAPRFFAAVLMLLIVLPFTAPFASCDFASLIGESAVQGGVFDAKTIKEETTAGFIESTSFDLTFDTIVCNVAIAFHTDIRPIPLSVLRV